MTQFVAVWDSTKEVFKKSTTDLASVANSVSGYDYDFPSASGTVGVPQALSGKFIHVYVNGIMRRVTSDYTVDTGTNQVNFIANQIGWIRVEVS